MSSRDASGADAVDLDAPHPFLARLEASSDALFTGPEGRRVAWRRWGAGPYLVLLHGGSGSWRHWACNIKAAARHRTVLAVDLPGFGLSDGLTGDEADLDVLVARVAHGLDALTGGAPYDVAAFSYGGSTASQLVRQQPGRQRSLTLVSAAGIVTTQRPPIVPVRHLSGPDRVAAHRANLLSLMLAHDRSAGPLALTIQHLNTSQARLRPRTVKRGAPLSETLQGLTVPVAAVWGERDNFLVGTGLNDCTAALHAAAPHAAVHILPDAGHWAQFEAAAAVNAILSEMFID